MNVPDLFQRPDDDDELDLSNITSVSVKKQVNGSWTSIPMAYDIEQIDTAEKLYALLGPGFFELIGRDDHTKQIVRRVKVTLPGIPWRAWDRPDDEKPPAAPFVMPAPQSSGGSDAGLMVAVVQLMGQQMQATSQMVMAMLQMNASNSDKHVQAMAQMFTNFGNAQSGLLEKVMQAGSAGDPQNAFLKGVETAAEIQRGAREATEPPEAPGESMKEMVEAVSQGIDVFSKVKGLAGGAPSSS